MNEALQRFREFCRTAAEHPVQVDIHLGAIEDEARSLQSLKSLKSYDSHLSAATPVVEPNAFAHKVVAFACGLGALAAATSMVVQQDPQPELRNMQQGTIIHSAPEVAPVAPNESDPPSGLKYVHVRFAGEQMSTLDIPSRIQLAKDAAKTNALETVGLNWRDVYGVIHAETGWIARNGMGKNGVPSYGLAQLEPATATALQVSDPHDPVQAVDAAARLMKDAAIWSQRRVNKLNLSPSERAQALRAGVSVYYNLSTAGRHRWNGSNSHDLPLETQRHIQAAKEGAKDAGLLERRTRRSTQAYPAVQAFRASLALPQAHPQARAAMRFSGGGQINLPEAQGEPYPGLLMANTLLALESRYGLIAAKSVATYRYGALPEQFTDTHKGYVKQLQVPLTETCAIMVERMSILRYTTSCLQNTQATAAMVKRHSPVALNEAFAGAMLTGVKQGYPVLLVNDDASLAFAASYFDNAQSKTEGKIKEAILITTGLLEDLKGHPLALEFILAHEVAHIRHHHLERAHSDLGDDAANNLEIQSDVSALEALKISGVSREDAGKAVEAAFEIIYKHSPPDTSPLTDKRYDAVQRSLQEWEIEISEAASHNRPRGYVAR